LVVTEGVFSMDGDSAPLAAIAATQAAGGWLLVDDAHGIGVVGDEGRGAAPRSGAPGAAGGHLRQGFGVSGAAVLCTKRWPIICCSLPVI
jgi:8-amino-7-oxononanoate synthase